MQIYSVQGIKDFIVLTGYKGELLKQYFRNLNERLSDFSISLTTGERKFINYKVPDWNITILDTGYNTMTGGRLLRAKSLLVQEQSFFLTYGDGLANVNLRNLLDVHNATQATATVTAVKPPSRFGQLQLDGSRVVTFSEKPPQDDLRVSGGFFVFRKDIFDFLKDDTTVLERFPLHRLSQINQVSAYLHDGYWQCMDTMRDLEKIKEDACEGDAPWLRILQ